VGSVTVVDVPRLELITDEDRKRSRNVGITYLVLGVVTLLVFTRRSGDAAFGIGGGDSVNVPASPMAWAAGVGFIALGAVQLVRGLGKLANVFLAVAVALFIVSFLAWAGAGDGFSFSGLVNTTVQYSVPITFGAMAGIICERSGIVNIAIEGMLLGGAFTGTVVGSATTRTIGILAAIIVGALLAMLLAVMSIRYRVDQVIVGFAINFFVLGVTSYLDASVLVENPDLNSVSPMGPIDIPLLSDIPVVGELFKQNFYVYASYFVVAALTYALWRTRWGLRTRAIGEHPLAADTLGVDVLRMRFWNVALAGAVAGFGGSWWPAGNIGRFDENITGGRGFIALAAVIFGRWHPVGAFCGALVFGFFDALSSKLSNLDTGIPSEFLQMAPYIATIVVVAGFIGRSRPPAASGKPYEHK
jgi:general nucleoside transport system permease protein